MPARDWKFRIEDIITNMREILDLTQGMDFASFSGDKKQSRQCSLIWQLSGRPPDAFLKK
jgi:uncharacterized protein with HEPN domain